MPLRPADLHDPADLRAVTALWREYLTWAVDEIGRRYAVHLDVDEAMGLLDPAGPFAPPGGRIVLAEDDDGVVVGTGAAKPLGDALEIKRMYVRPEARGTGLGRAILDDLLAHARTTRRDEVLLDSNRFMTTAHALYRGAGFRDTEPYPGSEIPTDYQPYWVFMRRTG